MVKQDRDSNIELLRIVLMFMIVCLHVFDNQMFTPYNLNVFTLQLFVSTMSIVAVNSFVFISGYYGIKLKLKSILSLVIQALFYSWLILLVFLLFNIPINLKSIVLCVFPIISGSWWFLTVYVVLMIISPYLNKGIDSFSKKQNLFLILALLLFNCSSLVFGVEEVAYKGYTIFHFISIYCIARFFSKYKIELKKNILLYFFPLLVIFIVSMILYIYANGLCKIDILWAYNNPLIIISSIALFYIFKNLKFKSSYINKIAPLAFGVYLIHNHHLVWSKFGYVIAYLTNQYKDQIILLLVMLLLLSISIFICCLIIEKVRQIIFNPIVDRINLKLNKYKLDIY